MHRIKIGLGASAVLLLATIGFFFSVSSDAKTAATRAAEESAARAQRVYHQLSRLAGSEFANLAADRARRPDVVAIADRGDETARRQAAFEECEVINAGLQKESRKADLVAILDAKGKVLARDLNPNAMYGDDLRAKFPAVDKALKGEAVKDIWTLGDRMTEIALAPIARPDGTVTGALLLGHVLSAKKTQEHRDLVGAEIGYFHGGKVHTSSFVSAGDAGKEDVRKTQALAALLFSGLNLADEALKKGGPTEVRHQQLDGDDYAVVVAPLPGNFADKTSGVVLLSSISGNAARAGHAGGKVLMLGLLAILVALGAAVLTAMRFLKPLDAVEMGVAEVINGNIDYTFEPVGPDFEGLSNSINVMLARLLGRDDPNEDAVEEEDEAKKWKAEQMNIEEGDGAAGPAASALAQESESSYYPRLFNEYVSALRTLGKPTEGVSVQAFMAKLRLSEAGLRQKWTAKLVRFQLQVAGDQITFRAVRLG